jgi:hypothetical protein
MKTNMKTLISAVLGKYKNARGPPSFNGTPSSQTLAAATYMDKIKFAGTTSIPRMRWLPIILAAMLAAGAAVGGWATSKIFAGNAAGFDGLSRFVTISKYETNELPVEDFKPSLIGSYVVTGTDSDGKPYDGAGMVDISLVPSGALELVWDNGKQAGVGQVIGNVLAVACLTKGRTAILIMNINPDGSLSGKWSRRTDRGYKGSETWKKP